MKKRLRIVLLLLVAAGAGFGLFAFLKNGEDAAIIRFSGNIEVTEAQMSFRIPGRLRERAVAEGDSVGKGQTLARLETADQVIALAQAEANLAYAESVLAELLAGSRVEEIDRAVARVSQARESLAELQHGSRSEDIERGRAELASAEAAEQTAKVQLNQAKNDFTRYSSLYRENSVSKNLFEIYQTALQTSEQRVKEAESRTRAQREQLVLLQAGPRIEQIDRAAAALKQAEAEYALIKAGPRRETIDQARAKVRMAVEGVNLARQQLSYTELVAPMAGVILTAAAEVGEYLNPASPVVTIGQIDRPWLRAYIGEGDLGRIRLGQEVAVSTDSFPGKSYPGTVSYIASEAEFTPKTVQTFEERAKLMYRIKVSLANPHHELKPGMPADGRIELERAE
ncbi:MAG TPA: efflux RND transporter periplasmic adaptor subunit [Desulforhopalus sp.]|nr:efflux RND transporter periplasmic adaptor subunit [Desulforhopalus sp.]